MTANPRTLGGLTSKHKAKMAQAEELLTEVLATLTLEVCRERIRQNDQGYVTMLFEHADAWNRRFLELFPKVKNG